LSTPDSVGPCARLSDGRVPLFGTSDYNRALFHRHFLAVSINIFQSDYHTAPKAAFSQAELLAL